MTGRLARIRRSPMAADLRRLVHGTRAARMPLLIFVAALGALAVAFATRDHAWIGLTWTNLTPGASR